jgi:hypothetical protein
MMLQAKTAAHLLQYGVSVGLGDAAIEQVDLSGAVDEAGEQEPALLRVGAMMDHGILTRVKDAPKKGRQYGDNGRQDVYKLWQKQATTTVPRSSN